MSDWPAFPAIRRFGFANGGGMSVKTSKAAKDTATGVSQNPYCRCLYYAANALARNVTRMAEDAFAPTGLAPSYAFLLMTVNKDPGVQPSEIARVMMLQPSTVTRLIDKMEAKGYLERRPEGKSVRVHPTARSVALQDDLEQAWSRAFDGYSGLLGADRSRSLTADTFDAAVALERAEG